jgi:hypothetical protein
MNYIDKIGTVSINQAKKSLEKFMRSKEPVLLRGRHGIGKSEVVYQAAEALIAEGLVKKVIEKRLSQITDGEMTGLQKVDGQWTQFVPVDWIYEACTMPVVLFLDEIDRALKEIAQGAFQLMDSRCFNGMTLHPGTVIVAAVNGGLNGKDYQVRVMDPAELSRYCVIDVREDFRDWLEHVSAKKLVPPQIMHFLTENEEFFCPTEIKKNVVQPSPRSWVKLSKFLMEHNLLDSKEFNEDFIQYCRPRIGTEASMNLVQFLNNNYRKVTIFDILENNVEISKLATSQISEIIEYKKLLNANSVLFSKNYNDTHIKNLANFIENLPEEFCMAAIGNILFSFLYEQNDNHENLLSVRLMRELLRSERIRKLYHHRSDELTNTNPLDFVDSIVASAMISSNEGQSAADLLDSITTESGIPRTKIKWDFVVGADGQKRLNVDTFPGWEKLTPEEIEEQKLLWPKFFEHNKKIFHGPHPDNNDLMRHKTWRCFGYFKHDAVKFITLLFKDPVTNRITWFNYIIDITSDTKQHDTFEEMPVTDKYIKIFNHPDHIPVEIYNEV